MTGASELAASAPAGWLVMGAAFGGIAAAAPLATGLLVCEPAPLPSGDAGGARSGELLRPVWRGLGSNVRTALAAHGFPAVLAVFVLVTAGVMVVNSVLPFFPESVLGLPAAAQTPLSAHDPAGVRPRNAPPRSLRHEERHSHVQPEEDAATDDREPVRPHRSPSR